MKLAYSVAELQDALGIGRASARRLAEQLGVRVSPRRLIVPRVRLERWLEGGESDDGLAFPSRSPRRDQRVGGHRAGRAVSAHADDALPSGGGHTPRDGVGEKAKAPTEVEALTKSLTD